MSTVKISDQTFTFNNVKYRRTRAEDQTMFGAGYKRDPIHKTGYLEPQTQPGNKFTTGSVEEVAKISLTDRQIDEIGFQLNYKGLGGRLTHKRLKEGSLVLAKFVVTNRTLLVKDINRSGYLRRIRDILKPGKKERLISTIWLIVEASESKLWKTEGDAKYSDGKWSIAVSGGSGGYATWEMSSGTPFAYEIDKIHWEGRGDNKEIDFLTADKVGL